MERRKAPVSCMVPTCHNGGTTMAFYLKKKKRKKGRGWGGGGGGV